MSRLLLSLSVCLTLTASLPAQDKTDPQPATGGADKGAKPPTAGAGNPGAQPPIKTRTREERMRYATGNPDQRRSDRLDRMMDRATEMYQLDDAQKITARNEIKSMQDQRRAAMGAEADEYDQLQKRQAEIISKAGPPEPTTQSSRETIRELRKNPELRKIRDRMQEIDTKHPFDWDEAIKRIEATLPPEQAAKGHALWEQRKTGGRNSPDRFPRFPREEADRENRRREREQKMAERNGAAPQPQGQSAQPGQPSQSGPTPPPVVRRELHPWEIYTRQFIKDHELTDAQSNSAMAILKDMRQRAEQVDTHLRAQPHATTQSVTEESKKQTDAIFEEMKQRLDGLLTAEQRAQTAKP